MNLQGHQLKNCLPLTALLVLICALVSCSPTNSPPRQPLSDSAMLVPSAAGKGKVEITVLATAGETASANSDYRMVGVGDGIGVYAQDNKIIAVMNHELNESQSGAFVSRWVLDSTTHQVIGGEDLTREVFFYPKHPPAQAGLSGHNLSGHNLSGHNLSGHNMADYKKMNAVMSRLCSADLPAPGTLAYTENGLAYGTDEKIFFSGEETNTSHKPPENRQGRAFAHMLSGEYAGISYELPALGRMSFENIVLNPVSQKKTIAMLMDDAKNKTYTTAWDDMSDVEKELVRLNPPSELYVYIGEKQSTSDHPLERAGLTNGNVYGVRVLDEQCPPNDIKCRNTPNAENREAWLQGDQATAFELRKIIVPGSDEDGHGFQIEAYQTGVTQFLRLEDGAWDPRPGHQNDYYFVTTDYSDGNSRLFKLTFKDIAQPEEGGVIRILINGNPQYANRGDVALVMMDNLTVDPWGRILIQEDPGSDARLAKIWMYDIDTGNIKEIARTNPNYFDKDGFDKDVFDKDAGAAEFLTTNEETSGIVPAFDTLGEGWYLLNVQAHAKHQDSAIVQHGQFLKMYVPREL